MSSGGSNAKINIRHVCSLLEENAQFKVQSRVFLTVCFTPERAHSERNQEMLVWADC